MIRFEEMSYLQLMDHAEREAKAWGKWKGMSDYYGLSIAKFKLAEFESQVTARGGHEESS